MFKFDVLRSKSNQLLVSLLGLMILLCGQAVAQNITATVVGTVQDAQRAVVPGASVTATNIGTGISQTSTSGDQGQYRIDLLPVGNYSVTASAAGFKKITQENIVLTVDQTQRVDLVLTVGAIDETVTVDATPPQINTSTAEMGNTVESKEITSLPLVGRNVYSLLALTPGVQQQTNTLRNGAPVQTTYINGGSNNGQGSVSYYLDGGMNMTFISNLGDIVPGPDAVEEFRVETNNYSAQYGRFGAGVVTVLTKSGSNQFHGSLFEFYRNGSLNASPWRSLTRPPLSRNQFGVTLGGPIRRDQAFFFVNYGGLRQNTSTNYNTAVLPTALERKGDFSQSAIIPTDPTTGKPFAFNGVIGTINPLRLDPTALALLSPPTGLPGIPTTANLSGNVYQATIASPYNTDDFLAKIDYSLQPNQKITVFYFNTSGLTSALAGGNLPWSTQTSFWRQQNANLSHTWTINPSIVNQAWLTFARTPATIQNNPNSISLHDYGSDFLPQGEPALPQVVVSGAFTLGQAHDEVTGSSTYALRDVVLLNLGPHSIVFGGEGTLSKSLINTNHSNYGQFNFTGVSTVAKGAKKGNPLADFLLGLPATVQQQSPIETITNSWSWGVFVQDVYRITRRLTVTPGLRYDIQTPPTDPRNFENAFVPGQQSTVVPSAPLGQLFVGDPGIARGVIPIRKTHFSPRLGLAWDPLGDGKTSVRAAGGIFFGSVSGATWNVANGFAPFSLQEQFNNVASLTHPYANLPGGKSPFPYVYNPKNPVFVAPAKLSGTDLNFQWPYTYQTNVSIQRQVTRNLSLTAAYVGAFGNDLPLSVDLNYSIWSATATTKNVDNRRPLSNPLNPALSSVLQVQSHQTSSYNALQVIAEQRAVHGISFRAYYVYSKNLSSASSYGGNSNVTPQDYNNLAAERGRSGVDQRHIVVASAIWDVSYFRGQNLIMKSVLNGWQISPILKLHSGSPLSITTGSDNNFDGNNTDRPDFVPGQVAKLDPHRSRVNVAAAWFNTAAFTPNGAGVVGGTGAGGADGNVPVTYLDGPGYKDIDMAIFRNFKFLDRYNLQLRVEGTNVFNQVSLSAPTTTLNSALFGQISSAQDMRQLQLGARLTF